jgi:TolB protein
MSETVSYLRSLAPGQRCRVWVADVATGTTELVFETDDNLFEAPNWARAEDGGDGELVLNGEGVLWSLRPDAGARPRRIDIAGVPDLNNDHVLAPSGREVYVSANDWQIYAASLDGGDARRITRDNDGRMHFLHGVSPDGGTLAYIGLQPTGTDGWPAGNVYTIGVDGSDERQLTTGSKPADGSEYSPDGEWIYLNTEAFSTEPGHAQIARMRPDGSGIEQLTFDERVNWFPHLSPGGDVAVYLSYPSGTVGHPPDLPVRLCLVRDGAWHEPTVLVELFGGQGTINVNSWAPTGGRFAFLDYPVGD